MTARTIIPAALLALAAVAVVIVLLLRGQSEEQSVSDEATPPVAVDLTLSPRILGFGDTLTATVSATVDRRRVDPDSVRVRQKFSPWESIVPLQRTREDSDTTSLIRTTYVMRCMIGPCVPPRDTYQYEFDPAVVSYRRTDGHAGRDGRCPHRHGVGGC